MAVEIFKDNFVNKLRGSIVENLDRYGLDDPWIDDLPGGKSASLPTKVEPLGKFELLEPDGADLKDVENSIRLHKALAFLTPVQARDPRLWTRLAHVEFWSYMRSRWDAEKHEGDKAERYILAHYFIAQNQSRALLRHGIARLWWYGKVTYDQERKNPYELTGVLLSLLDITQQILERNMGRVPQVMVGFLEFLLQNKKDLMGGGSEKRAIIRHLAKYLNICGGISLLDCLSKSEVITLLEQEYTRLQNHPEFLDGSE